MTIILFIAWLFASSQATTAPSTGGIEAKNGATSDVPCTAENPDPNERCNIVWGN
jgi:hypothetical protein